MPDPDVTEADKPAQAMLEDFERERKANQNAKSDLDLKERQQEMQDRSAVTGTIMTVFGFAILVSLLVLLIAGLVSGKWETLASTVSDILKSVLLPVVTLVLGYYFGRGGKS